MCVWQRLGISITAPFQADAGCCFRRRTIAAPRRRMVTKWAPPSVDARQLGVVDHLAVEVKPLGARAGDLVPELDEPDQLAVLIVAGQVGVGVAQAAALLYER